MIRTLELFGHSSFVLSACSGAIAIGFFAATLLSLKYMLMRLERSVGETGRPPKKPLSQSINLRI